MKGGKTMKNIAFSCKIRQAFTENTEYIDGGEADIRLNVERIGGDDISENYSVKVKNTGKSDFLGIIHIKATAEKGSPKFFMPGFMYNRNTADMPSSGRKNFPRIKDYGVRLPESHYWMTRSDRLAEPMALVYDNGDIWGISAAPYWVGDKESKTPVDMQSGKGQLYQFSGFTCDCNDGGRVSVGYTLGYENAPWLFVQTATVRERAEVTEENSFFLASGEEVCFTLVLYSYIGEDETAVNRAIRQAYYEYHQSPRMVEGMSEKMAVSLLSEAIRDYAWLESERMYSGFVFDGPNGYTYNKIGSLSWTNGFAVAVPMLMAANKLGDDEARRQSLSFIEYAMQSCSNPKSGLMFDAVEGGVWSVHGWWYSGMHSGGHSAYINGQAAYYILKAYLSERDERGINHAEWLDFVSPIIKKFNQELNSDYEYPFAMSWDTGAGIEYDSMGGAWCLAATALYSLVTDDKSYLDIIIKSEKHYYDKFVRRMECYGGPLDTDKAVDNEGILAYIRAARILHEILGESCYLEHLKNAIEYEVSFKLGYNTPIQVRPLSEIGWSSCGGSITSTANPHIHPMSSTVIGEMKYLCEHMQDSYIQSRLDNTVKWSMQTFNTFDKEYGYGRVGWMSERFCFCQGLLTEKYPNGETASTWFALMPWAGASIIEGLVSCF